MKPVTLLVAGTATLVLLFSQRPTSALPSPQGLPLAPVRDDGGTGTGVVDNGVPRIQWFGPRTLKVYGQELVLNGFRFGGHHSKARAPARRLATANGTHDYDSNVVGFSMPAMSNETPEMWVAAFGHAPLARNAPARIAFVPFLRVTGRVGAEVFFAPHVGTMTPGFFAGADLQVCAENAQFSNAITTIVANTATSITLTNVPQNLTAGDYLLPAPGPNCHYKYLRSFKLDYSPTLGSEWRNFVFAGDKTYSQTGNPWGTFSATWQNKRRIDLREWVSPLATGVFGVAQANLPSGSSQPAYITIFNDGVHYIAHLGADRAVPPSDGLSGMFEASFFWGQEIWVALNSAQALGAVTVLGWIEG